VVMTTEIFRNMLYGGGGSAATTPSPMWRRFGLDEWHYMNDSPARHSLEDRFPFIATGGCSWWRSRPPWGNAGQLSPTESSGLLGPTTFGA